MSQSLTPTAPHTPEKDAPSWAPMALSIMVVVASSSFVVALLGFIDRTTI